MVRYYITPDDYKKAKKNGISEKRLYQRVNDTGWDIERATTQPVRSYKTDEEYQKWKEIANKNGIDTRLFWKRTKQYGWSYKKSATTKKLSAKEVSKIAVQYNKPKVFTREQYAEAAQNGIKPDTLRARVKKYGWDVERAIKTPVMSVDQKLELARENSSFTAWTPWERG